MHSIVPVPEGLRSIITPAPSIFDDPDKCERMWRMAKALSVSPMVPAHLKKGGSDAAAASVFWALDIARVTNQHVMQVLQSIYFVGDKPGFSASYYIARLNASGLIHGRISFAETGDGDSLSVTATATDKESGAAHSISVGMRMARAEGWVSNKKYQTMPAVMLRYRAATMLIRAYYPEVMGGFMAVEELETMTPNAPPPPRPTSPLRAVPTQEPKQADAIAAPEPEEQPEEPSGDPWPLIDQVGEVVGEHSATEWPLHMQDLVRTHKKDWRVLQALLDNNAEALDELSPTGRDNVIALIAGLKSNTA